MYNAFNVENAEPITVAANVRGFEVPVAFPRDKGHVFTIDNGKNRVTFYTEVLKGRNYFKIVQVYDYRNDRMYDAQRYHTKYIPLITEITGDAHIAMQGVKQ